MKLDIKSVVVTGVAILLSGCAGDTASVKKEYSYNSSAHHIAQYDEESYYYRPNYSWSQRLSANSANLNNVASSGLLTCKEDDIWFISLNEREEEGKIRYRYMISLAKSQLMKMEDNATYIPRRDSKEFKDLIEIDTKLTRQGSIGCSSKISKEKFAKLRTM